MPNPNIVQRTYSDLWGNYGDDSTSLKGKYYSGLGLEDADKNELVDRKPMGIERLGYDVSSSTAFEYPIVKSKNQRTPVNRITLQVPIFSPYQGITKPIEDHSTYLLTNNEIYETIWKKTDFLVDIDSTLSIFSDVRNDFENSGKKLSELIDVSTHEDYQSGFDNSFTRKFEACVFEYGRVFLADLIEHKEKFSTNALQAVLDVLSRIDDSKTYAFRFWVIKSFLEHESPIVRDTASMSLVELADVDALGALEIAIGKEKNESLKSDMMLLLYDLKG